MKRQPQCRLNTHAVGALIREQSLKLWWVAEAAGIHKTTLRRWLSGEIEKMRLSRVEKLANVLQAPVSDLVEPVENRRLNRPSLSLERRPDADLLTRDRLSP